MATLKVRARANRLILDLEAMEAGARRYVGRVYTHAHPARTNKAMDAATKEAVRVDEPTLYDHRPHFPRHADSVVSKPARVEYMRAVKNGDLLAADEATAKLCGVKLADHNEMHKAESREEWEPEAEAPAAAESDQPHGDEPSHGEEPTQ